MKYPDSKFTTIGELITKLQYHTQGFNGPLWFRGQSITSWNLEPRLLRIADRKPETYYLNKFKQDATLILDHKPISEFEWLFLMQHYGAPTRLLDWSESPLVSLYFAVFENPDQDGALWVLLPTEINKKSNYRPDYEFEVPSFEDMHMKAYLPSTIASEQKSKLFPMAAIAPRNSTRMQAQKGVFTISHRENIFINDAGEAGSPRDHAWRYVIPSASKIALMNELRLVGYNRFQLFPELASLSDNF